MNESKFLPDADVMELQITGLLRCLKNCCCDLSKKRMFKWLYGNNTDHYHGELCGLLWKFRINTDQFTLSDDVLTKFQQQGSTSCRYCRMTPIHVATITNNRTALELLASLSQHYVNVPNERGETALHLACANRKIEFVKYLLNRGADPNIRDVDGNVALHTSVAQRDFGTADILLSYGAEPDVIMFTSKIWTPLHYVVWKGYADMVDLLLKYGASIAELDMNDESPISLALQRGNENILKKLILAGKTQPNVLSTLCHYNKNEASVLHLVCQSGRYNIAKLLLDEGVDVDQQDASRRTALHVSAVTRYVSLLPLLLERGADIDAKDKDNKTPLRLAAEKRQPNAVSFLIKSGANLDSIGACLIESVKNKHQEITKTLLSFDINVDARNRIGKTALMAAVEVGDQQMVDYLLARGANPNLTINPNCFKRPIITEAIIKKDVGIVKALISAGADLCRLDSAKKTPLSHALSSQQVEVVELFLYTRMAPSIIAEAQDFFSDKPLLAKMWHDAVDIREREEKNRRRFSA